MKKLSHISFIMMITSLTAVFACFACAKEKTMNSQFYNTTPSPIAQTTTPTLQYLALGDSYTIGQSVTEAERFPAQVIGLLKISNLHVDPPKYIATTGWTTTNLIDAINSQSPSNNYDIVTLLIGVNDQYQHKDTTVYRAGFTALLNTAVFLAANRPSRVFVVSIPDYSATPYVSESDKARVSKEIDAFNAINKEVTLQHNIAYIDITPESREAANDLTLIADDRLHPSGKQYAQWAALIAPVIKDALK